MPCFNTSRDDFGGMSVKNGCPTAASACPAITSFFPLHVGMFDKALHEHKLALLRSLVSLLFIPLLDYVGSLSQSDSFECMPGNPTPAPRRACYCCCQSCSNGIGLYHTA